MSSHKQLSSNRLALHKKQSKGKPPKCPICLRSLAAGELRVETWLYGERSRHYHLECMQKLCEHLLKLIRRETGGVTEDDR